MTTHDPIPARLAALKTMPAAQLKDQWRELFGSEPPPYNRPFLESRLAYRIQELAYGGLKPETVRRLEQMGEELDGGDITNLIGHFPSVTLLPTLKRLLDEELRRYRALRQQAEAERWRGNAANEARMNYTNRYQRAFTGIEASETTALMVGYLPDEHFGETAALVLQMQWILANEPQGSRHSWGGVVFSRVEEMRAVRARCATRTCDEAEAIFGVIAPLIAESATDAQKKHAVKLAIQAVRLPHGERADTIEALLSIAPQAARATLVLNLILSGETIPFSIVQAGINDVLDDAKKHRWILDEGWQLKAWVRLLPFTDQAPPFSIGE